MSEYEAKLRRTIDVLSAAGKTVYLSEMGFSSGVGYSLESEKMIRPIRDNKPFGARMTEYVALLAEVSADYSGVLDTVFFYEWWDNHHHRKIWNVEQSSIHTCFGLCDERGEPKPEITSLVDIAANMG